MRLLPDRDERELIDMLREIFAAKVSAPNALWKSLAEAGMLTLTVPDEFGGSAGALTDLGVFFVEAGRSLCPLSVHATVLAGLAIDALGSPSQRASWLPDVGAGVIRVTTSLWNPRDAGIVSPSVQARLDGARGWRLSGRADFVLDADSADYVVVTATDESSGKTLAFVVGTESAGLCVEPLTMMGKQHAGTLHLDDVAIVGENTTLGCDGAGITVDQLRRLANTAVALLSLDLVGVGEAALQRTVDYTAARHQFGRPIASFQAAQHLVANMHIAVSAARLAARSAVFWIGRGRTATRETAIARMHAAAAAKLVTLDAHQLHGGMGYVVDTDLHRYSERARVLATLGGGADVAATWLEEERSWPSTV
jgi:alkylation response protein AidB-like acyl-CoA dehydrogenase